MQHVTVAWQKRATKSIGMVANLLLEIHFATNRYPGGKVEVLVAYHRALLLGYYNPFSLTRLRNQYSSFVREIMLLHREKVHQ